MRRLVLVLGLLAACDDDSGGPIGIDDLGDAIANTYCNLYVKCGLIDSLATCRQIDLLDDAEIDADLKAAVDAGKVIYHPDKAGECLAAFGATCDVSNAPGSRSTSLACDQTFEGTVGSGGQCAIDEECISQTCDVPSCPDACCQGTCVGATAPVRPRLGESCLDNARCVDSFCDDTTTVCTAYRANGAACAFGGECESNSCIGQVCTARANTGQACGTTVAGCRLIGDRCDAASMTCKNVGLLGDACAAENECSTIYTCDTTSSTCKLGPQLGESCAATPNCLGSTYCDETTVECTARKVDGQPCDDDTQCASRTCDVAGTGTCMTPPICI